ncbi:TIGR04222 domain-containing membrane protein [Streptomyces chryseus]|uniref:TIGR04222 domain-containing membrane protein n=1 Tax=Streptomyces chryseus TaxID=68186 RepID=A0ABQ3DKZ2_9ACTN|nr:TIGR04222 domain-containing membrane protein [Streptomyces chryseus]GHA99036.1 hypothetical protein GCM10010346_22270 [Streptomyces chryseus]
MTVLAVLITLAVAASCVALTRGVSALHRGAGGGDTGALDLMEVAFLNGGPSRAVDTALTTMYSDGRLAIGGPGIASARSAVAHDPVERAVLAELAAAPNGALHTLRHAVMGNAAVQEIGDGLAFRGLMVPPAAGRRWRAGGTVLAVVCVIGLPASVVAAVAAGVAGASVGVFLALVLPTLITGLVFGAVNAGRAGARVTPAGRAAAAAYAFAHPDRTGPAHLVAVHGLRALPDPVLQDQLRTAARLTPGRPRPSSPSGANDSTYLAGALVWCAGSASGHASCGGSGGADSGSGGSGGSGCGSGGGGGSSCSSSSGSSCGSSSGSSCGSSS